MAQQGIRRLIVVGGGTAGWLTASHLARKHRAWENPAITVTLVESPNIPTIGVGEGTVPTMRQTLHWLGIRETDFIRQCDVTFKQSIKFIDWLRAPSGGQSHAYHHLFDYPAIQGLDPTPYWCLDPGERSYADSVSVQAHLCEQGLGPKTMVHPEFGGVTAYAYHLDAAKFSALLTRHAVDNLGVQHCLAEVTKVIPDGHGGIAAIETDEAGRLEGDLFVDCTGFSALLAEQTLGVPFVDKSDVLFVDSALAIQVPYEQPDAPIPCHTLSTATGSGWIWDIGLTQRRGVGHVYSSRHCSDEEAEQTLRDYLGPVAEGLPCRKIPMRVGYRERAWSGNCVAIGLSGGFVEPLEATGLLVFDLTARMLAELLPADREAMPAVAERFNQRVRHSWDRVIDFIKLHYVLSERDDTPFWRDNRAPESIPQSLKENLAYWRQQLPSAYDFASTLSIFNLENYLYVLYGMEFDTRISPERHQDGEAARAKMDRLQQEATRLAEQLMPHRQLIERIRQHGLQKV
ncbi:tryptophan halogenase family protein [Ferrimonas balearica]|uniref:tryptophan halogenase family protein n=1 Tax=Ferrimonas balearica TaxID=44012 RepID=UPI001C98E9B7|nr:tryptophan halogenase family protein [Ferrimonas balearica]MBY5921823.1 tryptophan 7-halogenase [Ferrimonas balearica]MBY5994837.1 tryptophan 7-halogenase [Ferrimonas balearica]